MGRRDLLCAAVWRCCPAAPGSIADPGALAEHPGPRYAATVPGTAAGAWRAAGQDVDSRDFDADDWWYHASFSAEPQACRLELDGLATLADVWLDGMHLLHSENMFHAHSIELQVGGEHELVLRFAALATALAERRPRPRWKVRRLRSQNLRWIRTSLLGRLTGWVATPGPVGPWRAITLTPRQDVPLVSRRLTARGDATLDVRIELTTPATSATLVVGAHRAALTINGSVISGRLNVPDVEQWWPHTHGAQPRYDVTLELDGQTLSLGPVGFRTIAADTQGAGFALRVNGVAVFCRGAYWTPLDPVTLVDGEADVRAALTQLRDAGLNMVRIGGETVYPDSTFLELCDELGLLVWHDCMFAFVDVPDDPELSASIDVELRQQFERLQGHPSLAVVSGGSEIEQQAAMAGIPVARWSSELFATTVPALVNELLPGVAFLPSSPSGGTLPIEPRSRVAHYYGVGAYLRDPDDARRANVRFAAECLAFATPPERQTVEQAFGHASMSGHHPQWKRAVHRDAGASWDFEDVVAHYIRSLFGIDPLHVRYADPERYLDLGRAAVAELFTSTLSEWRRPGSSCAGALVFHYRDLRPGAGLGIVDAHGRPKAPWYSMRQTCAPVVVLVTDEGLNGLDAHVVNDSVAPLTGTLHVDLIARGETCVESVRSPVSIDAHSGQSFALNALFDGFRDLSYAYRFGPPPCDVVVVSLLSEAGVPLSRQCFLPGGPARAVENDIGLVATATLDDRQWLATVSTRRFAQRVSVDIAGFVASDSWFHLAPGESRVIELRPEGSHEKPRGQVVAVNCSTPSRLSIAEPVSRGG